jgi:hypothetical protein
MSNPTIHLERIELGEYANDGTGDDLRTAFEKVNKSFDTITARFPSPLSEDTAPKLGGNLDLNGKDLLSNGTISIRPGGNGLVVVGRVTAEKFYGKISDISDHKLDELSDVTIPQDLVAGQSLVWNGTEWAPGNVDARLTGVDGGGAASIYVQDEGEFIDGGRAVPQ